MFVTLETPQDERSWLKRDALLNILLMFVTLETSQFPIALLNETLSRNRFDISVINETSQLLISLSSLQDPSKWAEYRAKGYKNNPYEKEAARAELQWKKYI